MKILVIEDDEDVIDTITLTFQVGWPEVDLMFSREGGRGVEMVEKEPPDVVILDLGLPDITGYQVLKQIRTFSNVPVVILTVMMEENDIIKGLEWGADDYIIKPFRKMELLARIKTILRRQRISAEEPVIVCGPFQYIPANRQLFFREKEVTLTVTESTIMYHLMKQAGHVVSHTSLAEAVWGDDYPNATDTLKVHIRHLREKTEVNPSDPQIILTRSGVGYSFIPPE